MKYICVWEDCFNLTTEVWCRKHRLEWEARRRAKKALERMTLARWIGEQ